MSPDLPAEGVKSPCPPCGAHVGLPPTAHGIVCSESFQYITRLFLFSPQKIHTQGRLQARTSTPLVGLFFFLENKKTSPSLLMMMALPGHRRTQTYQRLGGGTDNSGRSRFRECFGINNSVILAFIVRVCRTPLPPTLHAQMDATSEYGKLTTRTSKDRKNALTTQQTARRRLTDQSVVKLPDKNIPFHS